MIKQDKSIALAWEEYGQGDPLILLMGLGASKAKWAPHIQAYQKHFHVYALDNRGAGESPKPVSYAYTIEEMAEDVLLFMEKQKISSAHFNGISMGGAIAQVIAMNHPDKVRSLILTNTFSYCGTPFRRAIELLRESCGQLDPITFGRLCQWMIFSQPFQEKQEDYLLKAEIQDLQDPHPMPAYAYKAQCNAILGFDSRSGLKNITAPTLIVGGDKDLFVPAYQTQEMARSIPRSIVTIIPDGGHVQHWEHLENYNHLTLNFLLYNLTTHE